MNHLSLAAAEALLRLDATEFRPWLITPVRLDPTYTYRFCASLAYLAPEYHGIYRIGALIKNEPRSLLPLLALVPLCMGVAESLNEVPPLGATGAIIPRWADPRRATPKVHAPETLSRWTPWTVGNSGPPSIP